MNLFCASEGFIDIGAYIFGADVTIETGFAHQVFWLRPGSTNQHGASATLNCSGEFFERGNSGGIHGGHIAQTENDDRRQGSQLFRDGQTLSVTPNRKGP